MNKAIATLNRRDFLRLRPNDDILKRPANAPAAEDIESRSRASEKIEPLNIKAGLEPYNSPLDAATARHLLRRTAFGASPTATSALIGTNSSAAVDSIVSEAVNRPLPDPPTWANAAPPNPQTNPTEFDQYIIDNNDWSMEYRYDFAEQIYWGGLRERLALFWHDHFVTSIGKYALAPFAYQYLTLIRTRALGNFKTFVSEMGQDPSMLIYLDSIENEAGVDQSGNSLANENFARELLELFTMGQQTNAGVDNYSETDIQEIARALTGWKVDYFGLTKIFNPFPGIFFDGGSKSFFGRTGNFDYDDVIDIVFEERGAQTAEYICRKLYQEFVYAGADEAIVSELAQIFVSNNYELEPVISTLLKSAHFFDAVVAGSRIKSPVENAFGLLIESDATYNRDTFILGVRIAAFLEQVLLNPPNVAGWPGHHTWATTTSMPIRWIVPDFMLTGGDGTMLADLLPMANTLGTANDPLSAFNLPIQIAEHFLPVPLDLLDTIPIDEDFAGDLVGNPIPQSILDGPEYVRTFAKSFLAGTPWYEWNINQEGANVRLLLFLRYLAQIPEYQLT